MAGYLFSFSFATLLSYSLSPIDDNYSVCRTIRRAFRDTEARTQCVHGVLQFINVSFMKISFQAHIVQNLSSTCKLGYNKNLLKNLLNDYPTFVVRLSHFHSWYY